MDFEKIACDGECRFVVINRFVTLKGWTRIYDKNGRLLTHDPNTATSRVNCRTCDKSWRMIEHRGETRFEAC